MRCPIGYYRIQREVRDFISEDTIVVADGASTMDISRQVVNSYKPRHRIDAGVYGLRWHWSTLLHRGESLLPR